MIILETPCSRAADIHDQAWPSRTRAGQTVRPPACGPLMTQAVRPDLDPVTGRGGCPSGMMKIWPGDPAPVPDGSEAPSMAMQSVLRSLLVLEAVAEHQPVRVGELTPLLGLPKS